MTDRERSAPAGEACILADGMTDRERSAPAGEACILADGMTDRERSAPAGEACILADGMTDREGIDIMLRRWQEAREISRQERAAIAEAARAEGRAEGIAEGIAEGRAEAQRAWREWYQRQAEAQEKGRPFTEPPPTLNGDTYEE